MSRHDDDPLQEIFDAATAEKTAGTFKQVGACIPQHIKEMTTMPQRNEVYSIFGQIEEVVAKEMATEHDLFIITDVESIPETARFNVDGQKAKFAIIIPRNLVGQFERRIADLRA